MKIFLNGIAHYFTPTTHANNNNNLVVKYNAYLFGRNWIISSFPPMAAKDKGFKAPQQQQAQQSNLQAQPKVRLNDPRKSKWYLIEYQIATTDNINEVVGVYLSEDFKGPCEKYLHK